ncbi:MAG: hypothetical protein RLZZ142_713 [Verrucomicrobiota bacterium]|jgi:RNA polymerase sigma-70 factor (ECF subfamily)
MNLPEPADSHALFLRQYAAQEVALHAFVRSMLPNREEATEVMQEIIVVLWQKFADVQDFRPWAFGVARNITLRHLERRKRDRHVFDSALAERLADLSLEQETLHRREREALEGCLQKLPEPQRDLVLCAYTRGTRMETLALERNQTPMALYKLLQRIRQALLLCIQRTTRSEETA